MRYIKGLLNKQQATRALYSALCRTAGEPPESQWREFASGLRLRTLDKGEYLVRAGEQARTVSFVCSGLLRMFYLRRDGRELNKSFVCPPGFVGAFEALLSGNESRLSIQTLEPCTLLEIDYALATSFYERDVFWERFGRLLAERLFVKKARREAAFLMDTALQRYELFLVEHPEIAGRIPDYHIASYLGVTPEALSRLRRNRL